CSSRVRAWMSMAGIRSRESGFVIRESATFVVNDPGNRDKDRSRCCRASARDILSYTTLRDWCEALKGRSSDLRPPTSDLRPPTSDHVHRTYLARPCQLAGENSPAHDPDRSISGRFADLPGEIRQSPGRFHPRVPR